jgi:hypothetical protein
MNNRASKIRRRPSIVADRGIGGPNLLAATARTLREACCETGLDRHGQRCPDCPVADLCADDSRWLVRRPRWTH